MSDQPSDSSPALHACQYQLPGSSASSGVWKLRSSSTVTVPSGGRSGLREYRNLIGPVPRAQLNIGGFEYDTRDRSVMRPPLGATSRRTLSIHTVMIASVSPLARPYRLMRSITFPISSTPSLAG